LKKGIIICIVLSLILAVFPQAMVAEGETKSFSDIKGHWAESAIQNAVKDGYVTGFPDGTFKPNKTVTAAEFVTMLLKSVTFVNEEGYREYRPEVMAQVPEHFRDSFMWFYNTLPGKPWYQPFTDEALRQFIIRDWEYEEPFNEVLTREKAASIINRYIGKLDGGMDENYAKEVAATIKDQNRITSGRQIDVAGVYIRGVMNGYTDGTFGGKREITRAESISLIERVNRPEKRKPYKMDLSGYPYSIVPTGEGYGDRIVVFGNWEMKQVHDQLVKDMALSPGAYERYVTNFAFYENEEVKQRQINTRRQPETWWERKHYYDLGIAVGLNSYSLSISSMEGRYERQNETLNRFLSSVFKDKAGEARKFLDDSMAKYKANNLKETVKVIGGREIIVGGYPDISVMVVGISGYADR